MSVGTFHPRYNVSAAPLATMDEQPRRKPAVLPPAPSSPDDGPGGAVQVPRLEPPPSSLKPLAQGGRARATARESRGFWVLLVMLFVAGTAITFYLQR
jgi:hypothetical protein